MSKKYLLITFFVGLSISASWLFVSANSSPQMATTLNSLTIQNTSQHKLTFTVETVSGERTTLGVGNPNDLVVAENALAANGLFGKLPGNELTIHAKDENGNEFFTLLIDKDEILQRNGFVQIPGAGGRRAQRELSLKSTAIPVPTPNQ